MDTYSTNGFAAELAQYETPFADATLQREEPLQHEDWHSAAEQFTLPDYESPFAGTLEASTAPVGEHQPQQEAFVEMLAELNNEAFTESLYELAGELEDSWSAKVSNEAAMGDRFIPFASQQATEYFAPLIHTTHNLLDRIGQQFSGNFTDQSEAEIERFFNELETDVQQLTPAQEQFLGSVIRKVGSVVKKGVALARKGVAAVGRILPIQFILNKLKGLIRPLLNRVLRFAINKLPRNLQAPARTLANRLLNRETNELSFEANEMDTTAELEMIQMEFDTRIAQLVMAEEETTAENLVMEYEGGAQVFEQELQFENGGVQVPTLEAAQIQLINDLKNLPPGASAAPAIEKFLPAAILALQPIIKMALSIIGRNRVINFLAKLLAQLVSKYIPAEVARPLAAKIIDIGMSAIGFETFESNKTDVAYEAVANTLTDTIRHMGNLSEAELNDETVLTETTLEAFEQAVANNFPNQFVREGLRTTTGNGVWVLKPRTGGHKYKKYARVFSITIDPQTARVVRTFRGIPLATFLRDKLGLDTTRPIQARVHLYEAIPGTWLSHISRSEQVPGLGSPNRQAYIQLHPLGTQAAALLLKEPGLGKDFSSRFTTTRHRIGVGQRFYFLEIAGARIRVVPRAGAGTAPAPLPAPQQQGTSVPRSSDIQAVINFVRSEIRVNYFFGEEEAREVVEKLNRNDYLGAGMRMRTSVRNVLHGILLSNVGSKVKIIHEAVPELFLDNYAEQEAFIGALKGAAAGMGKQILMKAVEKLVAHLTQAAYQALVNYFKARAAEFKQAQALPLDGVTVKIIWVNVPGLSAVRALIHAIKGNLSVGNLADLALPSIPTPDVRISAGKNFD